MAGRGKVEGFVEYGGQRVQINNGLESDAFYQLSAPLATVTVYKAGTLTLATIYSDEAGTAKSNPFAAATNGYYSFYADETVDIRFSGGGLPATYTRGGVVPMGFAVVGLPYIDVTQAPHSVAVGGITEVSAQLQTALRSGSDGTPVVMPAGDYLCTDQKVGLVGNIRLSGRGARIQKQHGSIGLEIIPEGVALGATTGAATTTTLPITGAAWTANEHVDKWVSVASTPIQHRRVVSNTADTLTLDHALDVVPGSGVDVAAYTPLDYVEIDGLEIDGTGSGAGAGLLIRFADRVVLRDVNVHHHAGNGVSLHYCRNVRTYGGNFNESQFGLFIYHSDDVIVFAPTASRNTSEYGIQLKDCRGGHIIAPYGEDNAQVSFNIKCSGLNPAYDCSIVGGRALRSGTQGYKAHALAIEGTTFAAEQFSIVDLHADGCQSGLQVQAGAGATMDCAVSGGTASRSTSTGVSISAARTRIRDLTIRDGQARAFDCSANDVSADVRLLNNNRGATAESVRMQNGATNCNMRFKYIRTTPSALTSRVFVEQAGASANRFEVVVEDSVGGLSADTLVAGSVLLTGIGPNVASAATIAPTRRTSGVTGNTAIDTITVPAALRTGESIVLIPRDASTFTWTTNGNISVAGSAVRFRVLTMTWDAATAKWHPSYV